jgi:Glycosyltransferase sugar-binding region containing DXD motif
MIDTHMFWAYGNVSNLEILCMNSFLNLGYDLSLWTYGDISNAPKGTKIRDARDIMPEENVFLNGFGSYASFSDLFRYATLCKHGGLWADTDVIALIRPEHLPQYKFLVTQRSYNGNDFLLNNNVIFNPTPSKGDVIELALAYSSAFPKAHIGWPEIGPNLLMAIVSIYPSHGFKIMAPDFANPVDWWECPHPFLATNFKFKNRYAFIHLYNEMWRRNNVDKNAEFPGGSLLDLISRSVEIKFEESWSDALLPIQDPIIPAHISVRR